MFGIGGWELLVIVAVALLVLGPRRLPSAARAIGRGLQSLRRATIDLRRSIELDPEMEDLPQTLDEIGRPIITPGTLMRGSARTRPRPDQDFGDGAPPLHPRPETAAGASDGEAPPGGEDEPAEASTAAAEGSEEEAGAASPEPPPVEVSRTPRAGGPARADQVSARADDGREEGKGS